MNNPKNTLSRTVFPLVLALMLLLNSTPAFAHVKWFSEFDFVQRPLTLSEIITPTFIALLLLSVVVIGGMVVLDRQIRKVGWYGRLNDWFIEQKEHSVPVMRFAMAALLLISWSANAVLAPELESTTTWLVWSQFVLGVLLLFPRTVKIAGVGLILLYFASMFEFGFFHMLDYLHYIGIGFYLAVADVKDEWLHGLGLPALYATVGFSLIWLGFEKLVYPGWSFYLLEQNPQLALGLPFDFFLTSAAFVEIALGYLLLIGLLERPLAAIITLVFFTTTLVFGKIEVIGHTPLHAALVVFLFNGPGHVYKAPIDIHKKLNWRIMFAVVNLVLVAFLFGFAYTASAAEQYETAVIQLKEHSSGVLDLTGETNVPDVTTLEVIEEAPNSYLLHVEIENWTFTPELTGQTTVPNEGHAHIFINGVEAGRMYDDWHHLGALEPGENRIVVTLNGNDHTDFIVEGQLIGAETTLFVE